jgi:cation diffusion facilitator CzcD-associated flavoprotein CzcO
MHRNFLYGIEVTGLGGDLRETVWRNGARAYLGITVPGFPNFFLIFGPNTNITSSVVEMMEAQCGYILQALDALASDSNVALDLREEVMERFDQEMQGNLAKSAYATGCGSYFRSSNGRVITNWAGNVRSYRNAIRVFSIADYTVMVAQS